MTNKHIILGIFLKDPGSCESRELEEIIYPDNLKYTHSSLSWQQLLMVVPFLQFWLVPKYSECQMLWIIAMRCNDVCDKNTDGGHGWVAHRSQRFPMPSANHSLLCKVMLLGVHCIIFIIIIIIIITATTTTTIIIIISRSITLLLLLLLLLFSSAS